MKKFLFAFAVLVWVCRVGVCCGMKQNDEQLARKLKEAIEENDELAHEMSKPYKYALVPYCDVKKENEKWRQQQQELAQNLKQAIKNGDFQVITLNSVNNILTFPDIDLVCGTLFEMLTKEKNKNNSND